MSVRRQAARVESVPPLTSIRRTVQPAPTTRPNAHSLPVVRVEHASKITPHSSVNNPWVVGSPRVASLPTAILIQLSSPTSLKPPSAAKWVLPAAALAPLMNRTSFKGTGRIRGRSPTSDRSTQLTSTVSCVVATRLRLTPTAPVVTSRVSLRVSSVIPATEILDLSRRTHLRTWRASAASAVSTRLEGKGK